MVGDITLYDLIESTGNTLFVLFKSDNTISGMGFSVVYQQTSEGEYQCWVCLWVCMGGTHHLMR